MLNSDSTKSVIFDGEWYPSVEHAYQASRFEEPALRDKMRRAPTEGAARQQGELWPASTPDWDVLECSILADLRAQAAGDLDELI